jgi:hypothetical protein
VLQATNHDNRLVSFCCSFFGLNFSHFSLKRVLLVSVVFARRHHVGLVSFRADEGMNIAGVLQASRQFLRFEQAKTSLFVLISRDAPHLSLLLQYACLQFLFHA